MKMRMIISARGFDLVNNSVLNSSFIYLYCLFNSIYKASLLSCQLLYQPPSYLCCYIKV